VAYRGREGMGRTVGAVGRHGHGHARTWPLASMKRNRSPSRLMRSKSLRCLMNSFVLDITLAALSSVMQGIAQVLLGTMMNAFLRAPQHAST
jgi:hypothetical protein